MKTLFFLFRKHKLKMVKKLKIATGDRPVRRTAKKLKTYEEDSGSEDH